MTHLQKKKKTKTKKPPDVIEHVRCIILSVKIITI